MKTAHSLWNEYFDWLIRRLDLRKRGYNELLYLLFETPFRVIIERDNNRLEDGKYLRNHFFLDIGVDGDFMEHPVSVLEVLVALSERIENEYIGNPSDPRPDIIFWEMICNLGLDGARFSDGRVKNPSNLREFDRIIDTFLDREYDFYGNGSIFPVKNVNFDVKNMELWEQMQAYLSENYANLW